MLKKIIFYCFWLFLMQNNFAQEAADTIMVSLEDFEIIGKENPLSTQQNGEYSLRPSAIERLPQFMGSSDPIRSMQLLPGVQTVGEGGGGLFISGMNPSQSLTLLDGTPIFNPIHLGGFFSTFNSSYLGKFTLQKGYIAPEFGGRLGAVLLADSRTYIPEKTEIAANLSLLVSDVSAHIPINEHSLLSVSGRVSYLDPTLYLMNRILNKETNLSYQFYDTNVNYFYKKNKNEWKVGFYGGQDILYSENLYRSGTNISGSVKWHNLLGSVSYTRHFNQKENLTQSVYYSEFGDNLGVTFGSSEVKFLSKIEEFGYKATFAKKNNKLYFKGGGEFIYRHFTPQYLNESDFGTAQIKQQNNFIETALFAQANYHFSPHWQTNFGLRGSTYFYKNSFDETSHFANLEPRAELILQPDPTLNFSVTAQRQAQYINQVLSSAIGFPSNFWVSSNENIPYQSAHAFILSGRKSLSSSAYEISGNIFYRKLYNQFESSGYLSDLFTGNLDELGRFVCGDGDNYGTEILLKKNSGKLTGWIGYSLTWAWRNFDKIEQGARVPAMNDRRHDLNIVVNYFFSTNWDFSASFVAASGTPATFSNGIYLIGEMAVNQFLAYNLNRLPAYHRLDISATRTLKIKYFKESKLNFSIYNVYGHENPILFSSDLKLNEESKSLRIKRRFLSPYSILPSIGLKVLL